MTNCQDRLSELTYTAERVLEEDLAALKRMPEQSRIERYNDIKANEEDFSWSFREECPEFLTEREAERVRGNLRLARLLLAASFYAEGDLPRAMEDDFIEAELQAVVEFDRYKQFDVLDEEQIERRIRRMEGEVYELVEEYTATQIANMDELIDNPEVQSDLIDRLVDRYEDRRERIRQGLFVYIETHGMEHMVESIEEAIEAVADASAERGRIRETLQEELEDIELELEEGFERQRQQFESQLRRVERDLASETVDVETVRSELRNLGGIEAGATEELQETIERTKQLESRLDENVEKLETARERAESSRSDAREDASEIVETELQRLTEQRTELRTEIERLQREREQIEHARDRLGERHEDLETKVEEMQRSVPTDDGENGIDGSEVVTAATARLFEMDYIGRFDTTMYEIERIERPNDSFEIPDGYWEGRSQRRSDAPRMVQLLGESEDISRYPTNPTARYEITERRYLGLSEATEMIIEATVYSDLEAYAANGFDATAADIDDLLTLVNDAVREADRKNVPYLLAIASPTGWTDRVKQRVADDELSRSHYSRQVRVCLVDLRSGEFVSDESDPLVGENIELFDRAVAAEQVERCTDVLRDEYVDGFGRETLGLEEVVEDHGFDRHVVKQSFERLENAGDAAQFYVDGDGLAVDFS
jgi:hypothetical protein